VLGVRVRGDDSKVSPENIETEIRLRFEHDLIKDRLKNGKHDRHLRVSERIGERTNSDEAARSVYDEHLNFRKDGRGEGDEGVCLGTSTRNF
jgi:hypothetical protein